MSDTRSDEPAGRAPEVRDREEAPRHPPAAPDPVRMRCPVCEAPAEWASQKWRCRRCGWLSS